MGKVGEATCNGICDDEGYKVTIYLNKEIFLNRRETDYMENIETIYHEFEHIVQKQFYTNPNKFSLSGFLMAKDNCLVEILENYYQENYAFLTAELDAECNGYLALANDLEALGLNPQDMRNLAQKNYNLLFSDIRFLNGENTTLDILFDKYVTDTKLLNKYPILKLQYKELDGKIVKKSIEEIREEMSDGLPENIMLIYGHILSGLTKAK